MPINLQISFKNKTDKLLGYCIRENSNSLNVVTFCKYCLVLKKKKRIPLYPLFGPGTEDMKDDLPSPLPFQINYQCYFMILVMV